MKHSLIFYAVIYLLSLGSMLSGCTDYTIPEDALYPLKIGILVWEEGDSESTLQYLQPGETRVMYSGGTYNGKSIVNTNMEFSIDGGYCVVTSDNKDIEVCRLSGATPFYHEYFGDWARMVFDYTGYVNESGFLALAPLGANNHHITILDGDMQGTLEELHHVPPEEHDYYLTAEAFDADGKRIVKARMKIVNLRCDEPILDYKSPYYSVTLEEYTLSDNYMMFLQ